MIAIIEEHNLLTGFRFVIVEYLLVGLALGLLGSWYAAVGRPLDAAIWLGMTVNCAVIVLFADAQLRSGRPDFGTLPFRDRAFRRAVGRERPHLMRRTLTLVLIQAVPLLLAALVVVESLRDAIVGRERAPGRLSSD